MIRPSRLTTLAVLTASFAAPLLALAAQSGINLDPVLSYSIGITQIINWVLIPVLMAIALVTFFWGIFKYFIWGAENESDKVEGRKFAMWGIIGFVIIFSVWALVGIVRNTLDLNNSKSPKPPTIGPTTAGTVQNGLSDCPPGGRRDGNVCVSPAEDPRFVPNGMTPVN